MVSAYERRLGSHRALAAVVGVRLAYVETVLRRSRATGELGPKPRGGGQQLRVDAAGQAFIRQVVRAHPDATREDLCARLADMLGVRVSLATMCRVVPRLDRPRKKHRSTRRLKVVDESGVNLAMPRLYGRAPRGTRVIGGVPQHAGQNVTRLGRLGAQGLQAVMTVAGATDAEVFRTYVKRVLGPTLRPGDIVAMDTLRAHKAVGVQQTLARRGARLVYLPPSSPDLSAIEPCWAKVETTLRAATARTRQALDSAITHAIATVTHVEAQSWLMPCGYALR